MTFKEVSYDISLFNKLITFLITVFQQKQVEDTIDDT